MKQRRWQKLSTHAWCCEVLPPHVQKVHHASTGLGCMWTVNVATHLRRVLQSTNWMWWNHNNVTMMKKKWDVLILHFFAPKDYIVTFAHTESVTMGVFSPRQANWLKWKNNKTIQFLTMIGYIKSWLNVWILHILLPRIICKFAQFQASIFFGPQIYSCNGTITKQ